MSVLWGTLLLTVALRHPSMEACLADLGRNAAFRRLIGIESEAGVPKPWNMSRFLEVLGTEPHRSLLHGVFDGMIRRLPFGRAWTAGRDMPAPTGRTFRELYAARRNGESP